MKEGGTNTFLKHTCQKNLYYSNIQYYYVASSSLLITYLADMSAAEEFNAILH